jgi:N6-adenosine-specific RNA methylase IME4
MSALVLYDRACRALAEAHSVDEIKGIRDHAAAVAAAAKIARNGDLVRQATEIKLRAERRAGELLREMVEIGAREDGGRPKRSHDATVLKLDDLGVSKSQSSRWQKLAELELRDFEAAVAARAREAERAIVASRGERQAEKKEARAAREADLGARQRALPERRYGVIYADPEWRFEVWSRETGMDRAADNHYPTSDLATILARDVASIAAPDCALFLWATAPMLREGLATLAAWGFAYKSHCVWAKDRIITGYWWRGKHELLLLGVRGDVPAPAMGLQLPSVIEAPLGEHSAKPDVFAEMIEMYFPSLPKIELNRRGAPRKGWDAWGNEAEGAP